MNKIIKSSIIKFNIFVLLCTLHAKSNINQNIFDLKLKVIEKFQTNSSFKLIANHPQKKIEADFKILSVKSDTLNSKIFMKMIEPKQISNMSIWVWNYTDKTTKTWLTGPLNGKVKEVNDKNLLPFNIPLIGINNSIFDGNAEVSKIGKYAESDVYQIDIYRLKKNKKFGPLKKIFVDTLTKNILKIENLSKKGKLISEIKIIEYENDFPKIISIYESKGKRSYEVRILDFARDIDFNDESIFDPKDLYD